MQAGGAYQWVQLISVTDTRTTNGVEETQTTGGMVLDFAPNTPLNEYWAFRDSPYPDSPASLGVGVERIYRSDVFKTYLMWKFKDELFADSIWVPICATNWYWIGDASLNASGGWQLTSDPANHSHNPESENTTDYPVWTRNLLNALQ